MDGGLLSLQQPVTANPNMLAQGRRSLPGGLLGILRQPSISESDFFRSNPSVSGMASEDNRVVINPASNLTPREKQSVMLNEYARILMRTNPQLTPNFPITQQQSSYLNSTHYKNATEQDRAATIAARLFSGDPSAGQPTPDQGRFVGLLRDYMYRK